MAGLPVPEDFFVCPVNVPTVTFGAARYILTIGASVVNYMSVAPESTMSVAFLVEHFVGVYGWLEPCYFLVRLNLLCLGWD